MEKIDDKKQKFRLSKSSFAAYMLVLSVFLLGAGHGVAQADIPFTPFYVYKDRASSDNHFFPTGWMGDQKDLLFKDDVIRNARDLDTCIKISYQPSGKDFSEDGWVGVYWQNPANNWGTEEGAFDLTGAQFLTFWAKGLEGGEVVSKFQIGGLSGNFPDSSESSLSCVKLTKEWKKYSLEIKKRDLSYISGGFCLVLTKRDNPDGLTLFIDEIRYE